MFKKTQKRVAEALCCIIASILVGGIIVPMTFAQDTNQPTKMKPVVVTGSLLPTFETITPAPVDVYTAAEIEKTGVNSLPQLVQRLPAISGNASFGDSRGNGG